MYVILASVCVQDANMLGCVNLGRCIYICFYRFPSVYIGLHLLYRLNSILNKYKRVQRYCEGIHMFNKARVAVN